MFSDLKIIHRLPDVIIMDYQSFNHDIFNLEEYFINDNKAVPYIYYNDPCPTSYCLSNHWLYQTIRFYKMRKKETAYDYLILYTDLEEIVTSPKYSPYINLLCKPQAIPAELFSVSENTEKNTDFASFKNKVHLPENIYKLFILLYENRENFLSPSEIINLYSVDNKNISETSFRVMISNLKKYMQKDENLNFILSKNEGKYKLIQVLKTDSQ